jgi:hypothetical protein
MIQLIKNGLLLVKNNLMFDALFFDDLRYNSLSMLMNINLPKRLCVPST